MTSRERILTTLQHKEPDRVPVDLNGMDSTGIIGIAYNKLRKHLRITSGLFRMDEPLEQIAEPEDEVLKLFGIDVMPVKARPESRKVGELPNGEPCLVPEEYNPERLNDGSLTIRNDEGIITAKLPKGCSSYKPVYAPLSEATNISEIRKQRDIIASVDTPKFVDEDLNQIALEAKRLSEETDYALMLNFESHIFAAGQLLRGWVQFMEDLVANVKLAEALMDEIVEIQTERFEAYANAVGEYIDIVQVADDLGMQTGPQISPELYRKVVKPYHKRLYQFIKQKSGKPLFLHTDGGVRPLIPDLIEIGVDILNPIQVSAEGMNTAELKRDFGDVLTFWGGCDTHYVLPFGTAQQVKDEVHRLINDLAPGGGFVLCAVHNIQPEVKPENVVAMYETVVR